MGPLFIDHSSASVGAAIYVPFNPGRSTLTLVYLNLPSSTRPPFLPPSSTCKVQSSHLPAKFIALGHSPRTCSPCVIDLLLYRRPAPCTRLLLLLQQPLLLYPLLLASTAALAFLLNLPQHRDDVCSKKAFGRARKVH